MRIAIFGLGYVGTTSMACLASLGHNVIGNDVNADKIAMVKAGISPVYEPGVSEMLSEFVQSGLITATADTDATLADADCALICVGTPSTPHGTIDGTHLLQVVADIARIRKAQKRIVPVIVRSTALPDVHRQMVEILQRELGGEQPVAYCVHPEFLRAGQAVADFMAPPKIVFGCSDAAAEDLCRRLYPGFEMAPVFTDPMTASVVKYADNCFHAVKVTFANEIGMACKQMDVDARKVMDIFCQDTKLNISPYYLRPGFAFGGSCLPKDLRALVAWSRQNMVALPMLDHVLPSNNLQVERVIGRIIESKAQRIGLFGLAFKEKTDDLRESPMVALAEHLLGKGRQVRIYDPALSISRMVGSNKAFALASLPHLAEILVDDPAEMVAQSDTMVVTRRFPEVSWAALPWRATHTVHDLVGDNGLQVSAGTAEGLYWPVG